MIYQLPNGRIIELSIEEYLSLTDEEIRDLNGLSNDYTSDITNPFYKSALKNKQKKDKNTPDPHEREPNLDEIKDIEKMGDSYFHRDDV
jgi:hypothetical protein|tara:strand:- start:802 stop:1068 length:267 start_codon:yes stop_codon:yes gene_type:complete